MSEETLEVNTTGWIEISCDKCGHTSCYDPQFYKPETGCFGCMPCVPEGIPLERWINMTEKEKKDAVESERIQKAS